jgi:hypothetical protein
MRMRCLSLVRLEKTRRFQEQRHYPHPKRLCKTAAE